MTTETQLPQGWKKTTLGEIAIIKMGQSPDSKSYNKQNEGYQLIGGASDLGDKFPEPKQFTSEATKLSKINDIIICIRATIGRLNLSNKIYCLGRGVAGIEAHDKIETKFLWYVLMNSEAYLLKNSTGTTFQQVSSPTLKKLPIVYPTNKETQQAIVNKIESIFTEIDAGIVSLKTAQQQLKHYRQSLLKNAFNGELTKQWRLENTDRLPSANELLAQIQAAREQHHAQQLADWQIAVKQWEQAGKQGKKPSKPKKLREFIQLTEEYLPNLPKEWCWVELSSISSAIRIGPFGSLLHKADYINNGIPLINPSHIKNRKIIPDFQLTVSEEKLKELNNYIMRENDIVIGRRGEMGRCAVVTSNENGWLCGTGSMFVRPLNSMSSEFFAYIISSERVRDYLSNSSIGTTMQNLNEKILHTVPVPLCSPQEQLEILRILDACFTACDQLTTEIETQLKQAELLKQAVLKSAFSGNLLDK